MAAVTAERLREAEPRGQAEVAAMEGTLPALLRQARAAEEATVGTPLARDQPATVEGAAPVGAPLGLGAPAVAAVVEEAAAR